MLVCAHEYVDHLLLNCQGASWVYGEDLKIVHDTINYARYYKGCIIQLGL